MIGWQLHVASKRSATQIALRSRRPWRALPLQRGSGLKVARAFSEASRLELEKKVDELCASNEELQKKVDSLIRLVERQGAKNLMQLQNLDPSSPTATPETFRPTLEMVANQTTNSCQLDNQTISNRARGGDPFARRERVLRNIMQVDKCSWDEAHERLIEMDVYNEELYWVYTLPYRIGITAGIAGAVGAIMLVFHGDTALWYAENVVGDSLPEGTEKVSDMSVNQVGTWTWSWMEPMIGVGSFVLLCLQFSHGKSLILNWAPYTEQMMLMRAKRLHKRFPAYDPAILNSWARHMPAVDWKFMPRYRRHMYTPENRSTNYRTSGTVNG